jgi:hypothetical protein
MNTNRTLFAAFAALTLGTPVALADNGGHFRTVLRGFNEVPSIVTGAFGRFKADLRARTGEIHWELSYDRLEGAVTQAHIHVGERHTNGGVSAFLCANPPITPPPGTQPCPPPPARISGTITAADVIGPAGQGVAAGEFDDLVRALKAGAAYANVHTSTFPGGEIRGQLRGDDDD